MGCIEVKPGVCEKAADDKGAAGFFTHDADLKKVRNGPVDREGGFDADRDAAGQAAAASQRLNGGMDIPGDHPKAAPSPDPGKFREQMERMGKVLDSLAISPTPTRTPGRGS